MGNVGTKFCQGCNNVCGDGKSYGESDLTNNNNIPITSINNPIFFNNKTSTSINDPKANNENSFVTTLNSRLPPEEEQKKTQLFSKNDNNNNNNLENINDYYNNNYNYNLNDNNNNSLYNSKEFSLRIDKDKKEEIGARKITNLFRKLISAKKLSHQKLIKEISQIPPSEYIIGLNLELLNVNLSPEDNCIFIGNKFKDKKDGLGLEIFNNSNATYFGIFRNGKRVDKGKFKISNQFSNYIFYGEVQGIYAKGFGIISDKKKYRDYEGYLDNSMKSGYGIEKYMDNSEYRGCFFNGKKEGIGRYIWSDNSFYEGEWKENRFNGYGVYQFHDGSEYRGEWRKGKLNGFGEFISPGIKKYFGFFHGDKRNGFGFEIFLKYEKAFIGFWKNNIMNEYGKLIFNGNKTYGYYQEGKLVQKYKKKDFYKKIKEECYGYFAYFQMDDYKAIVSLINGENEY